MSKSALLFFEIVADGVRTLMPSRSWWKLPYRYAFIVHPRHERDIYRKIPLLRFAPIFVRRAFEHHFWPVTVSRITGLKTRSGNTHVDGYVISIPMTAAQMLEHRERAVLQIRRAIVLARTRGARIVALGAMTASLTHGGKLVSDIPGVAVTTGHAYTGLTVSDTALAVLERARLPFATTQVAIVGAAGSIGSLSSRLLCRAGVRFFILIDIHRKIEAVKALKRDLESQGATVLVTSDMSAIAEAAVIVTATSAPEALITKRYVRPGHFIVDDAQPTDVAAEVYTDPDVAVVAAGAVHTPGIRANFPMGLRDKEDNYCCLAEALVLASQRHDTHYVIGSAALDQVDSIAEGGRALGFSRAEFQNEHGPMDDERFDHVAALARAHEGIV